MGMYTDFGFCAFVKEEHSEIITILKEMCKRPNEKDIAKLDALASPDAFFTNDEGTDWHDFFWYSQYELLARPPLLTYNEYMGVYKLQISISIKNYWDQIANFIKWIKPYCTNFVGYTWYEEDEWPEWFKYDEYNDDEVVWQKVE